MKNVSIVTLSAVAVIAFGIAIYMMFWPRPATAPTQTNLPNTPQSTVPTLSLSSSPALTTATTTSTLAFIEPVAEFKARITKKPFGIHITPQNSPVQPEKFTGYHTGVDVEYADVTSDIPVLAIANGEVVQAQTISGYGGVVVIQHTSNQETLTSLYGHLDPASLVPVGTKVTAGQQIGILGDDKSRETDGERKHLHFAILSGTTIDVRGYVPQQSQLSAWRDPLLLF